ncbi:MAG: transposase [Candidatus Micrarchaeota archaeon]
MLRTFKFRLYPSKAQRVVFERALETCRQIYDDALAERKNAWENERRNVSYYEQQNKLPALKKNDASLARVHSQVLQDALRRVEKAFQNFFRRSRAGEKSGYPRFKPIGRFDSFAYPQFGNCFEIRGKKLWLSKIGEVNIKLHRELPANAKIKTCIIRRDVDQWFACFTAEMPEGLRAPREIKSAVGVDLGVANLVALSTGEIIENPRWLKQSEQKLSVEQRLLAKKKKGSKNRGIQRLRVAKLYRKIRRQRSDFLHKLSRKLVDSYDLIVFENLNIKKMIRSHFAKVIADAAWRRLILFMAYKAEEAGTAMQFVDAANTSQQCSGCGAIVFKELMARARRFSLWPGNR